LLSRIGLKLKNEVNTEMSNKIAMLVEDEPILRTGYKMTLERAGYQVDEFDRVDDALPHLGNGRAYGLIVSDIQTPGRNDGRALIEQAKEKHPDARVIGMSARGLDAIEGCSSEPDVFLQKPFGLQELTFHASRQQAL
tara:strand:- start:1075 stop:1488 length:414 start_codon:yes stop_codon:yes gene_type:complete